MPFGLGSPGPRDWKDLIGALFCAAALAIAALLFAAGFPAGIAVS